jgi:hypothetical protein
MLSKSDRERALQTVVSIIFDSEQVLKITFLLQIKKKLCIQKSEAESL